MVPKLRLSLFKDGKSSRWSLANLGEIVEFKKGKGISKCDISNDGTYPCVRYGELYTIYDEKIDKVQSKTNCDPSEHVISKSGDILIPASGETAIDIARASSIFRDDVILGGDINILTPKSNSLNSLFLSYSIVGKKKKDLAKMAQGNSVVHLYSSQLKTLEIWLPLIDEQTKIADFLSSVDEKITLLSKQHVLLCQYKKGMMQKIFSQELRFKDENGKYFTEWTKTSLEKICDVRDGTHSSPIAQLDGYPLITSKNLIGSRGIDFDNITYISKKDYDEINKRSIVNKGDILFSMIGTIGNLALVEDTGFAIKNVGLIKEKSKLKNNFLFFYLQFLVDSGYFDLIKSGNTQKFISLTTLRQLEVPYPIISEQLIIINFFSSVDKKIAIKKAELDKLKTWKQGLLQQMFV